MLNRIFYRLKQFGRAVFSKYSKTDEVFAGGYLTAEERALFNQLPYFEKRHSVNVARRMMELSFYNPELDQRKLVRLGLLHDIGKVVERNSLFSKSIMVLIRFILPQLYDGLAERGKTNNLFRRFYVHKHHGAVGAELLERIGVSGEFLLVIKKHDPRNNPWAPDDPIELRILQEADSY